MSGSNGNKDTRVAYGMQCSWWGSIYDVSIHPSGVPCCPYCHGILFEEPDEEGFMKKAQEYDSEGHPGYKAMIVWAKNKKCYPNLQAMHAAYVAEGNDAVL